MFQEELNKIKWKPDKILYTQDGAQQLYKAPIPESFWPVWRIHREKIKEKGISVKKSGGVWVISKLENIPDSPTYKVNLKAPELRSYQSAHAEILIQDLMNYNAALDASDTGTGKTFIALAIARHFHMFTIVIVPKTSIPKWKKISKKFGVKSFVNNYEQFKNGNTNYCQPFIFKKQKRKKDLEGNTFIEEIEETNFQWNVPDNTIIIFDEGHRCKNRETQNSRLLTSAQKTAKYILVLSATIADNPLQMYALGIVLGLFKDERGFWQWCYKRGVSRSFFGVEFSGTKKELEKVHKDIFPHHGHRIIAKDCKGFPENLIISDAYEMEESTRIQQVYDNMFHELEKLKSRKKQDKKDSRGQHLVERLRARQEIELLKIPAFTEMTEDLIEEGMSVAIFLNFEESVQALSKRLKTNCLITGNISAQDREKNRIAFQKGKERKIILNTQAGGESIDLHDEFGNYPRVSLISPTYSAQGLKQVLGRLPREGAKSKVIQKIIFAAGTVEEEVAERVAIKIENINTINDGDLI